YTSRKDATYINTYKNKVADEAHKITSQETSDAHIRVIDGKIYIIRNLYTTTHYTKFGTLILELNRDKLIDGISFNDDYELGFFIKDSQSIITYNNNLIKKNREHIIKKLKEQYDKGLNKKMIHESDRPYTGMIYQEKYSDFHFGGALVSNENIIFSELRDLYG